MALSVAFGAFCLLATAGCGGDADSAGGDLQVIATTSVLADIAQNVAGDLFSVETLIPRGADLHAYEPTPGDLRRLAGADLVIVNGAGLEASLEKYLEDIGDDKVVVASKGLTPREAKVGEPAHEHDERGAEEAGSASDDDEHAGEGQHAGEVDPHFWLDPVLVESYVDTIEAAFSAEDPAHAGTYRENAEAYAAELDALDEWTAAQVAALPASRRKLVMNHASYGYWADRYGFRIVGAVVPSVSTGAAPTAADLADLLSTIEREGVPAVFVEVSENPALAEQIAADAHIRVIDDLLDHSLTGPQGAAPTYIDMMKFDTRRIVEALRQ